MPKSPMSTEAPMSVEESMKQWNKYRSQLDVAKTAVIRAYLHLIRPKEGFPMYSVPSICALYEQWKDEEKLFYKMTSTDQPPPRVFPNPPYGGEMACWRMWALMIQEQVEGYYGQLPYLKECVAEIVANPMCLSHKERCPCKVSPNPWIYSKEVDALEPLKVKHNPKCLCDTTRYKACKQHHLTPPPVSHDDTLFGHTAPMFVCHPQPQSAPDQERFTMEQRLALPVVHPPLVEVGTPQSLSRLLDRILGVNDAAIAVANASLPTPQPTPFANKFDSFVNQANKAQVAIDTAAKASGGIQSPDFAKELFAAMGTPHDSICPHGLPFYSCMPCSH